MPDKSLIKTELTRHGQRSKPAVRRRRELSIIYYYNYIYVPTVC